MARVILFSGASDHDRGLWITDGTVAGTRELAVASPDPSGLNPSNFASLNGKVVFAGTTAVPNTYGLWVTDGTASGTRQLTGSGVTSVTGTAASSTETRSVRDTAYDYTSYTSNYSNFVIIPYPGLGYRPQNFTPIGTSLLFTAIDAGGKVALWTTDGTASGTTELTVAGASVQGLFRAYATEQFISLGNTVIFSGLDAADHIGLWVTDGTGAGTKELAITGADGGGLTPTSFATLNGKAVFLGLNSPTSQGIWSTDGTEAGTVEISAGGYPVTRSPGIVRFGDGLLFNRLDRFGQAGLWTTDGTSAGTRPLLEPATSSDLTSLDLANFSVLGNKILVAGERYGPGLYITDGTAAGTSALTYDDPIVTFMTNLGDKALFQGIDAYNHGNLWVTNGTMRLTDGAPQGTSVLAVAGAATDGLSPMQITVLDGKALFNGVDATHENGLFVTDGTAAGTVELPITGVGSAGLNPGILTTVELATPRVNFTDTTTGVSSTATSILYTGPVSYLDHQYIWSSTDGVAIAATSANVFLHGGNADDALTAVAGSNVLDGGLGSNFLTGATGNDGGTDTFYVDGRSPGVTWSTINNFHHGDVITLWGFTKGTSTGYDAAAGHANFVTDGAIGYQGATIHSELDGSGTGVNASLTIAGMSMADAASKLSLSTGTIGTETYLYIAFKD